MQDKSKIAFHSDSLFGGTTARSPVALINFGRQNIIVGGIVLFIAAFGGMALGFTMDEYFTRGFYALPQPRVLLKAGHTHGMPFALYNLIFGSLIDRLVLNDT